MTPYIWIASLNYFLMSFGLIKRKQRKLHIPIMISAILIDVSLVLILEFQRSAIDIALSFNLTLFQQIHVMSSSLATLLYIPLLATGLFLAKKPNPKLKKKHLILGFTAYTFRTLGFIFMFSLMDIKL